MRIALTAALLAAACSQAPPMPVPEATREAAGPPVDAGQRAANEPAPDAGQDVAGGIKQGASEAAGNVAAGAKEAAQIVAQAASTAAADLAEALQKLPPAPPIPDTPIFLPAVEEPRDNPTTPEKVWLGYQLFFDKRLAKDGSMSCESCHHPELAWTSGNPTDPKVGGGANKRNAPTVENVAYYHSFYWDGRAPTMEAVSAAAWKGQLGADPGSRRTRPERTCPWRWRRSCAP